MTYVSSYEHFSGQQMTNDVKIAISGSDSSLLGWCTVSAGKHFFAQEYE